MSEIFETYGIQLFLSLNFAAPMELGNLDSADPCKEAVQQWWNDKMQELYTRLPNPGRLFGKG